MTKRFLCLAIASLVAVSYKPLQAEVPVLRETETNKTTTVAKSEAPSFDAYAAGVYRQIDFKGHDRLDASVFKKALTGYMNLKAARKLGAQQNVLTVCDFSLPSNEKRMWVIDMDKKKVLFNELVAHGQGSGDLMATAFSNTNNSHQSSLGFYVTGEVYNGEHGASLRLHGQDKGFNDAAFDRGVVVHGAAYVNRAYAAANQRIGRSWGCPAVDAAISPKVIGYLKGGSCLFIYANQKDYLKASYWTNKKVESLPTESIFAEQKETKTQLAALPVNTDSNCIAQSGDRL